MLKGIEFLREKSRGKLAGGIQVSSPVPVILCPVHRILWQRVSNQVNKFALLFKRSMFAQDSRDKPENDGCKGRGLSVFSAFPLSVILATTPCWLWSARIHNFIAKAMSICVASGNKVMDTRLPLPVGSGDKYDAESWDFKRLLSVCCKSVKYPSPDTNVSTSPSGGEVGRSMIEMLGVLAIIGVLSVGGLTGYSKAMEKFKVNKVVYDFNMLVMSLLEHEDSLKKIGADVENSLTETLYALDMVPSNWKQLNSTTIEDGLGNWLNIHNRNEKADYAENYNGIVIDYMLGGMSPDGQGNNVSRNFNSKLCFELFNTVIVPLHNVFKRGRVYPGDQYIYYGDAYCGISPTHCLKDLTLSQIKEMCDSCSGTVRCNVTVNF